MKTTAIQASALTKSFAQGEAVTMVMLIVAVSSYIGIRKVLKVEPFDIFRG